jgi:hypothetical protein
MNPQHRLLIFVIALLIYLSAFLCVFGADADTPLTPAVDPLAPLVQGLAGKYGAVVQLCLVMGALRFAIKPLIAAAHYYAEQTETKLDDEFVRRIENSPALKTLLFLLDWVASIKLPKK